SATGTAGVEIFVTCNGSEQLNGYNLKITWDPAVMNVTAVTDYGGLGQFYNPPVPVTNGLVYVQDFSGSNSLSGDQTLLSLTCNALVHDGTATAIIIDGAYVNHEVDEKVGGDVTNEYVLVPGTFTTTDYTAPTISITNPVDGSIVSQTVNVAATVTDVGGVDADSIEVRVGGVEVERTLVQITNGYSVTAQLTDVPVGNNVQVQVSARDLTGNSAAKDHYVTVAEAGITFASPANGTYTKETQPVILANFVKVNCTTIKMFINNVDVTASCTWTGVGPDGTIALDYASYGALADDAYHVVVNGTSSLGTGLESDEVYFVKDTVAPFVSITNITDSDDDGFPEAGERLYVNYTAIDDHLGDVWFDSGYNTSRQSSGVIEVIVPAGNKELAAYARDLAGNIGSSELVHIYNNNLVYFDDPSLGSFAGLDLTKTALYDVFSTAKAFTLTGPNAQMTAPKIGQLDKNITPGSNVTFDNRKDNPIPAGSLPGTVGIYTTPASTLDFAVSVPNVTNATLMIAKANSTLIDQLITNPSSGALTPGMLKDLLDSKKIVLYGREGYAIVNVDTGAYESVGTIQVTPSNMTKTIRSNYVDLSTGFNTTTTSYGATPLQISKLGQGEYVLLAVCMDNDRFAIISATTFEVTARAGVLSTSDATYTIGQPVVVTSTERGDVLSAMVINSASTYTGNVTLNFTTLGRDTFQSAYMIADGNQTVVKPYSGADLWLTKGYGNATASRDATSVSVPTNGLLPGTYRVYMFLENAGNVTSYSEATITLTTVTPTPSPTPSPGGGGGGGGCSSGNAMDTYTGTGTLKVNSAGVVL
ncbi:MAG: PKD domain-containing protein, partial [Methanomicrobiales archaeon 53_19]